MLLMCLFLRATSLPFFYGFILWSYTSLNLNDNEEEESEEKDGSIEGGKTKDKERWKARREGSRCMEV